MRAKSDGRTIKEPCLGSKLGAAAPDTMIKRPQKLLFPCMPVFSEDKQSNLGNSDLSAAKTSSYPEIRLVITRGSYTRK